LDVIFQLWDASTTMDLGHVVLAHFTPRHVNSPLHPHCKVQGEGTILEIISHKSTTCAAFNLVNQVDITTAAVPFFFLIVMIFIS